MPSAEISRAIAPGPVRFRGAGSPVRPMVQEDTHTQSPRANWLKPSIEQHSLRQYLTTLRKRAWVVVLMVLVTTGATAAYVATAEEVYEAEADVLVTPVPSDDRLLRGLGLISSSSDPAREIQTVSRLIIARNVADRVDLDDVQVSAEPVAESNIVVITAEAPSPNLARLAANRFARAAIEIRTEQFQTQLEQAIGTLQTQVERAAATGAPIPASDLARLRALRGGPDPTIRLEVEATNPKSPIWPKPELSIAVGLLAGLVLGVGAVFLWQLLDPRLHRETDLKKMFGLPILARIPMERSRRRRQGALPPGEISAPGIEAFRALRFTLVAAQEALEGGGSLFITGPSPSEGKTTTCVNLASSLASMGQTVILIEADLRRPAIGRALEITPKPHGVASVLLGHALMSDALVTPKALGGNLKVLLADEQGEWMADQLSLPAARKLVSQAEELADFVIIDSPPVTDVTDTLPLALEADGVLLVVRLGKSRLDELEELGELLAQQGIRPLGIVLVGVTRLRSDYYYYGAQTGAPMLREKPEGEADSGTSHSEQADAGQSDSEQDSDDPFRFDFKRSESGDPDADEPTKAEAP